MSTNDVPGFDPANRDVLAMGCWAEHEDGSLMFVESVEAGRAIYSMFDMSKTPPIEYRDAMPEDTFKKNFSWKPGSNTPVAGVKWTWHDKTLFPWDKVIKAGARDGTRDAFAEHTLTAAERVAESLHLRGAAVARDIRHRGDDVRPRGAGRIFDKLSRAIAELGK